MSDRDTIPTDTSIIRRHLLQNRRALIDTGNRNRLVNFPIGSSKAKSIEIFDELSDEVFRILYSEGRKMSFDPGRASSAATEDSDILLLPDILSEDVDESRYTDTKLQTKLTPEGLQKRLTGLYRDARTVEQEQGIEILFLALGFLQWFEDPKSQEPRHAPLVLLPVELVRDNVRSAYKLQLREQDLSHNIGLEERLKQDLGISLPPLPEDENWLPSAYFQSVGDTIRSQERWTIRPNQIALGFFSFTKIAMFHDLDPDVWKGDELAKHPLIRGLLNDGFPEEERLFPEGASVDQIIPAADTFHVVDADSSQALVVEAIRRGRDLVVQGPPGTGKSQTIANVVAAAVMDGKKVLFVSEKIAALKVVHDRLRKVGLSPVCLELHSRNANKKAVVEELGRTLATPLPQQTEGELPQRLQVIRDTLNTQSNLLNTVFDDTGTTPFEALGMQVYLSSQGVKPPHFEIEKAAIWSNDEFRKILDSCSDYIESVASEGLAREHPWRGIGNVLIQPSELQRWQAKLSALAERLIEFSRETQKLYSELSLTGPHTFLSAAVVVQVLSALQKRPWPDAQLPRSLRQGGSRQKLLDCFDVVEDFDVEVRRVSAWFNDSVYNIEPRPLRDLIAEKSRSMLGRLSPSYKRALEEYRRVSSNPVPEQPLEMVKRLDCLVAAIEKEPLARSAGTLLQEHLGTAWQEARLNKSTVMEIFDWLATVEKLPPAMASAVFGFQGSVRTVTSSLDIYEKEREELLTLSTNVVSEIQLTWPSQSSAEVQSIPLDELGVKFRTLANSTEKYVGWCKLSRALATMENCGAGRLLEEVESGRILPTQMRDVVCFLRYEGIWNRAIKTRPGLAELEGQQRTKLVEEFRQLDIKRLSLATKQILFKHGQEMPRGSMGQMGIIRGEIGRQRGLMPVRKLMARAGSVLQQIKPVMLMSPLSVAQFLPPGSVTFDLLVMDEASQIKPEDALGAIARCRQLAVVGDKKQLPPTSFFDRMMNDEEIDEDEEDSAAAVLPSAIEMESILTLCEARGLPSRMLRWHYRSRHPSLIVVSNQEFYENNLFLPPSPNYVRGRDGFVARRVSGSYDRGGTRRNEIEAREVVKAIVDHAQRFPSRSLGVVTFSMAQKTLIEDLLENERRQNSKLEKFVTDSVHEPLFVKNLETVQGDERDVIFVSVGYGPRKPQTGLDSMAWPSGW
ncbi:MAG: DUF4011 domain-containing protein [Rhizobiales bacterium]|nr:DUF4011 domain-containing protein [Hyphomicrobiales bacterium]